MRPRQWILRDHDWEYIQEWLMGARGGMKGWRARANHRYMGLNPGMDYFVLRVQQRLREKARERRREFAEERRH